MWAAGIAVSLSATVPASAGSDGTIVVANRGAGTVSVIDTETDEVMATLELPADENPNEPMYVYHTQIRNRFFVGDRGNNRVVAFDADTLEVDGIAPAGAGVFHMWGSPITEHLWVNNDIDNTTSVISMHSLRLLATIPTPADLVAKGGKPHDVILSPDGKWGYVSVLGVDGDNDYVVQYDAGTFQEKARLAVGKDPHLSLTPRNEVLYVPCQGTNKVYVVDRDTLGVTKVLDVPGAHGAGMPSHGRYFYTTNLPGGGEEAIWAINTMVNQVVGKVVDSPYTVPHNIAFVPGGRKMYVTHSGPNDKVTIYRIRGNDPIPVLAGEVTTGDNPFGLAWAP